MNVIEALYITLGLDTRDFDQKKEGVTTGLAKLGEASDKQTKTIAESGKKAANAFSMLKIEVLGALAAFGVTTGLKDFITTNMNGQAALGRLSTNLGMSTQKLQAWKLAAKEMGQSGEDAVGALQAVAKGVAEARITGTSSLVQASRRFGFGIDPKDNEQTLINISRRMAETHDRQQAIMIAEAAGVGNIANLLLQGPDKLQAQLAHTMSLTGAVTKESAEQAALLQARWADLQERFQQVGDRVFIKLEPVLARLGERLATWLDSIDWQKVIDGISRFIEKVNDVVKAFGGWKTIAEVLGGVLALKLLSPLIGLVTTFAKIIPLIGTAMTGAEGAAAAFAGLGAAVGVAAAAFGGWKLGRWISENMPQSWNDSIGSATAHVMAFLGSDEAKQAIKDTHEGELSALSNGDKVTIGSDFMGKYDPMHSRKFTGPSGNATLFGMLENKYGLPAGTLTQKFAAESTNGTRLISPKGALGPMQFMPGTAKDLGLGDDVMDLDASAEAAAKYLAQLHKQLGSWEKAQAAYNWGPGNVGKAVASFGDQWIDHAPKETQNYLRSVPLSPQTPTMATSRRLGGSTDNSSSVTIGTLNVNAPKATDANGVAKGMQSAMVNHPLMGAFVTGLA